MRLQYDDEFDLDVRFTFSGMSRLAGGEPGRALPATAQGQTCGHRETCHTCETECQEATCGEPASCRTCPTDCDQQEGNTCFDTCAGETCPVTEYNTCPNVTCAGATCAGATCPPTQCNTCPPTQCNTCAGAATCPVTQCATCPPTQCNTCHPTCPGNGTCGVACETNLTCDCETRQDTCPQFANCGSGNPNCQEQ